MATRAQVETTIIYGFEAWISFVGISATPASDTAPRAYLGPAIGFALSDLGLSASDPSSPTDPEVAAVPSTSYSEFIRRSKYYLLESIIGNWDKYNQQVGIDKDDFTSLLAAITRRWEALGKELGIIGTTPRVVLGTIRHNWMSKCEAADI